ncbi:MAG: hypothetical protein QXS25_04575 [Candidatus Nitrosocaldus sp.]
MQKCMVTLPSLSMPYTFYEVKVERVLKGFLYTREGSSILVAHEGGMAYDGSRVTSSDDMLMKDGRYVMFMNSPTEESWAPGLIFYYTSKNSRYVVNDDGNVHEGLCTQSEPGCVGKPLQQFLDEVMLSVIKGYVTGMFFCSYLHIFR